MNIKDREQRYKILVRNLRIGVIDEATFVGEVDKLGFQDNWGRYWMIGAQSGQWYYYTGQQWQQADPKTAGKLPFVDEQGRCWQYDDQSGNWHAYETGDWQRVSNQKYDAAPPPKVHHVSPSGLGDGWPVEDGGPDAPSTFEDEKNGLFSPATRSIVMVGAAVFFILSLLIWPVDNSPPLEGPALAPSPRPTVPGSEPEGTGRGNNNKEDKDGDSDHPPKSAIYGTLLDLSTNRPGAGVEIEVNGFVVRTDAKGDYSVTGLNAGEYLISPKLDGQGLQAHEPVQVKLNGQSQADVKLAYYSDTQPLPTDTPQPQTIDLTTPPETLPNAGAPLAVKPWLLMGVGLLLSGIGVSWFIRSYALRG